MSCPPAWCVNRESYLTQGQMSNQPKGFEGPVCSDDIVLYFIYCDVLRMIIVSQRLKESYKNKYEMKQAGLFFQFIYRISLHKSS